MTSPDTTQQAEPKPLPLLADWLAQQHQKQQQEIADKAAAGFALLWSILQYDRLDESTPAWLHAVTLQAEQQFRLSEQTAFDFVQGTKWAIEPMSDPLKKVKTQFPTADFQLAMRATGPATVKKATQAAFTAPVRQSDALLVPIAPEVPRFDIGAIQTDVMALGKLTSTGAAVKHVLNGGRGEVQQLVLLDAKERVKNKEAIGWARVTEDSENGPCYFCALLASQGALYYNEDSFARSNDLIREPVKNPRGNNRTTRRAFLGNGPAKVHDHCKCTLRPVYRKEDSRDERARFFLRQWNKFQGYGSYKEKLANFRSSYVKPPPYEDVPLVKLVDVIRNRDLLAQRIGEDSSQVRWYDRKIEEIQLAS